MEKMAEAQKYFRNPSILYSSDEIAMAYAPREAVQIYQIGRTVDSADHMRTRVALSEDLPVAT